MPCYFFSGAQYIRVTRGELGPGFVDLGYPAPIANWGWGNFGKNGIDAALHSGAKCYFFSGNQYLQVTRGETGAGSIDPGFPAPITNLGWGNFGKNGIDAALYSGTKCYFFSGNQYIRVTHGVAGIGALDPGYPAPMANWGWGNFGKNGIDDALYSEGKSYFFSGNEYIRVTRGDTGAGTLDAGYPASIAQWGWGTFGAKGIGAALYSGTDTTPGGIVAPPARLGDNSNYFIHANGASLLGVVVTINIETDLVLKSATVLEGFSFQLNAYGGQGSQSVFQQYVLSLHDNQFWAGLETFGPGEPNSNGFTLEGIPFHALVGGYTLKAGYQLKIGLLNNAANAITGATFLVIDQNGQQLAEQTLNITPATVPLSPIVAFVLNVVGAGSSAHATFSLGSGSIIYQAQTELSVMNNYPPFVASDRFTTELSTSVYGELNAGPAPGLTQNFSVTPNGSFI